MTPPSRPADRALAQARADWLAGAPDAWARYLACVRRLDGPARERVDRPRSRRRAEPRRRAQA